MEIVVHKYGGSSVKDVEHLQAVAKQVADIYKGGTSVVVVVSAMGNTTNELLQLAGKVHPTPGRRELDMLVSVGERISMALLSMAIDALGVPAVSFTGSQSGIITDESHANARVVAVRPHRLREALEEGKVVIVAGFQGISRDKEVTTLGRGGSDTTAIALAAALNAKWCEIHSDVPGVFTADPREVPEAIQLDTLSLEEALNMARHGAKVLHDEALAYALREGIEIVSSATKGSLPGSRIQVESLPSRVTAIVVDRQLEALQSDSKGHLFEQLMASQAPLRFHTDQEILVDRRNWHDRDAFLFPEGAISKGLVCEVSAVGLGVGTDCEILQNASQTLTDAGIQWTHRRSSPDSLHWRIQEEDAVRAQRILHRFLVVPSSRTPSK